MSTVLTATEVADSTSRETPEPTDEELLQNFVPSIRRRVWPEAQVSYNGTQMSFDKASQLERENYLRHARARWHQQREEAARAEAAAVEREQEQKLFLERCSEGFHRQVLQTATAEYEKSAAAIRDLESELALAKTKKAEIADDRDLDLGKLQQSLAILNDTITAVSVRLTACQAEFAKQKERLKTATRDAQQEFVMCWRQVREPLVEKTVQALRSIISVTDFDAKELVNKGNAVLSLDDACGCRLGWSMAWPYGADEITLAMEVEKRFQRLDAYLAGSACHDTQAALDRCIGS